MKGLIQIFKLKIVFLLLFVAGASYLIASRDTFRIDILILLVVSGFLSASGSSALNNYLDRDIDRIMRRTSSRPLPAGEINPRSVLLMGSLMIISGLLLAAWINLITALFVFTGTLIYSWVYTVMLKRRTALNIVIGGFAGSCSVLAGFSAAGEYMNIQGILLSLLIFLWTPPHFWSFALMYREDYRRAGIPMLPAVMDEHGSRKYTAISAFLLLAFSLAIYLFSFGFVYLIVSILAGLFMGYLALSVLKTGGYVKTLYKFSGVYIGALFLGVLVDSLLF